MFPFVTVELPKFDLLKGLNNGLIPSHYLQDDGQMSLTAYVQDYLKEEVASEGLVRNIPAFSRFFDAMSYSHGDMLNFTNIARDCGVDAKTVREYYQDPGGHSFRAFCGSVQTIPGQGCYYSGGKVLSF